MRTLSYELSIPGDVVRARLEQAADRPTLRYWALPGTTRGRPVIGEVTTDGFWWRVRHDERASFAPWLSGRILPGRNGSMVIVELRSPLTRKVRVVMAFAAALLGALWIAVNPRFTLLDLLLALGAIAFVFLFPLMGVWLHKDEEQILRHSLEAAFDGVIDHVQTGAPPG